MTLQTWCKRCGKVFDATRTTTCPECHEVSHVDGTPLEPLRKVTGSDIAIWICQWSIVSCVLAIAIRAIRWAVGEGR